ncbi:MAG: filamentous hemagglutinin N-terminal domain-containing protein, partial [Synechococcus sp.]
MRENIRKYMANGSSLGKSAFISLKPLPLALLVSLVPGEAWALPEGLVVRGGSIGVTQPDASTLLIRQGTDRAAGDWRSFNIGVGERVNLQQPSATSLMLARITGGLGTEIFGQLSANGALMLLNPNGILIGPGAVINTASFAAGTLTMDPAHFMQGGPLLLEQLPGAPANAAVINRGTISVADAGLVSLIAPQVINQGLISARLGTIQLASGTAATVDLSGDGLFQVALDPAVSGSLLNEGQLQAQVVRIGASEAQALIHAAVNLDGLVQARGADGSGGSIVVASGGDVKVNGVLEASGGPSAKGGTIKLLGDRVALLDQARVEASGGKGGGEVLIGGNQLGQGPEPTATATVIAPGAQVRADALSEGDGGRVILWSDRYTGFYGTISARGGSQGGNGGFVETSSKQNLQAFGVVDAAAPQGRAGLWLLDPTDLSIADATTTGISFSATTGIWTPDASAPSAVLAASTLLAQLDAGTNVEITTSGTGSAVGDIAFVAPLISASTKAATLKLNADGQIDFLAALNLPGVSLEISKAQIVNYITGAESVLSSLSQKSVSSTTNLDNNVTTKGASGFNVESDLIKVNAVLKAEQGDLQLNAGAGGLDLRRGATVISLTALDGNIFLDSKKGVAVDTNSSSLSIPVTASKGLTINSVDGMTLNGQLTLKATTGPITVTGTIDGTNPSTGNRSDLLTLEATNGAITVNQAVGGTQPLNGLTVAMSAGTTFNSGVTVATYLGSGGNLTITNTKPGQSVDFQGNLTAANLLTTSNSYQVKLTGSTNTFASAVDFKNSDTVTLGDSATDVFNFNKGLAFSGSAPFGLAGVFSTGGFNFSGGTGAVSLAADTSINTAGGAISIGGNLNGPASTLTIDAGNASSASFQGGVVVKDFITTNKSYAVSLTGAKNSFTDSVDFNNTGTVTLGNASGTPTFAFLGGFDFSGNANINVGGTIRTPGVAQKFGSGSPTLLSHSSFDSTWSGNPDGANIALKGSLSGPTFDLTVNAGSKGLIQMDTVDLNLLTIVNAADLAIAGNVSLNNLITGSNPYAITFGGATNLFSNNLSNEIKFENKGTVGLGSRVGDNFLFGGGFQLSGNVTALNLGGTIRANGEAIVGAGIPTTLLASTTLDTTNLGGSGGYPIQFGGAIDGKTVGGEALTLTSGQGNITAQGAIGGTQAIGALTANSATGTLTLGAAADITAVGPVNLTAGGGINSAADIATNGQAVSFNSGLTLTGDQSIKTTHGSGNAGGANISFSSITDGSGSFNLDLNAGSGGAINASGAITINNFTISNAASATFPGNVQVNALIMTANPYTISLTGSNNSFTAPVDVLSTGSLTLGNGGDQFDFNGGITATAPNAVNLNGNVSAAGSGGITLGDADTVVTVKGNATIGGTSTGAINLGPATLADGVTLTAGNGSAATPINLAAVSGTAGGASSNLTFNTSGAVHVSGPVGTDIGTVTITNSGGTTFAGNVQINTLITTANPYAISFTGAANSIAQKVDFLNSGTVSFGDASGTDLFLLDGGLAFTGHAPSAIGGTIRTSSDAINFGSGGVTLLANSIVDTTNNGGSASGASINLGGTITDGVGSFGLDLNAGSAGSIYATVADAAGAITINLLKISNAAPNSAIFAGNVQVDSLVTTANPYSISFTGANNSFTQKVDFLNTGTVSLGDASGSDVFLFDGGLAFSGGAARSLGAILRSSADAIDLGAGATTLIGNTSIDTTNQGGSPTGAAISLASTVSGSAYNLTLNAGSAGTITSSGVDAAGAITLKDLTISNASSASFAGNLTLDSLTTTASPYSLSLSGSNNRFA